MEEYDIVIIGGGLVGLTAALLAAKQNFKVALLSIDKPVLTWPASTIDIRCSAINGASKKIMQSLDVWEAICTQGVSPYQKMHVWDASGFGEITFDANDVAKPELGHIIENRVMLKALWEKALDTANVKLIVPGQPVSYSLKDTHCELTLESASEHKTISATVILGADGAHSWLRDNAKIDTQGWSYQQSAIVAVLETEVPHQKTAWQRFLPEGPLAFLPLANPNLCSIVWTASPESNAKRLQLEEQAFCEEAGQHFDYRLGKIISVNERRSFPLEMQHAKQYVKERIALLGDAMHVIHPLAGLGVNLGFQDALSLIEILSLAKEKNEDLGAYQVLRRYERARKGPVISMIALMEGFKRLFASQSSIMIGLRSLGLNATDSLPYVKQKIMNVMGD